MASWLVSARGPDHQGSKNTKNQELGNKLPVLCLVTLVSLWWIFLAGYSFGSSDARYSRTALPRPMMTTEAMIPAPQTW